MGIELGKSSVREFQMVRLVIAAKNYPVITFLFLLHPQSPVNDNLMEIFDYVADAIKTCAVVLKQSVQYALLRLVHASATVRHVHGTNHIYFQAERG